MPRILTLATSALALAAAGVAAAQDDTYTPPADDGTRFEQATTSDDGSLFDDALDGEALDEPQGDANDDEGEPIAPGEDQLGEDGQPSPGDPATLPETETPTGTPGGDETEDEALPELEPEL